MSTYSARAVAIALDAPLKWVDNVLSHHFVPGASHGARGVERQLGEDALLVLALTRYFAVDLGVPLALGTRIAAQIANSVSGTDGVHRHSLPSGLVLEVPAAAIARRTQERLVDAAEAVAHIKRGRPKQRLSDE